MKKVIYILALILSFGAKAFSNELIEKAEKAYDSKKYKEAISYYEKLISGGYKSYQL